MQLGMSHSECFLLGNASVAEMVASRRSSPRRAAPRFRLELGDAGVDRCRSARLGFGGIELWRRNDVQHRPSDGRSRGEQSPSSQTRRGAGVPTARMRALIAALPIRMVGAVCHRFYEVELNRKENLTCYTPYLAHQLMVGDYC